VGAPGVAPPAGDDALPDEPPPPAASLSRRALVPAALFLLTFLTTTAAGAIALHPDVSIPFWQLLFPVAAIRPISDGLSYSVPLMGILLCHEFGHYFVARAHGVHASLPHFIPLPPLLGFGTMGAVIGMRQVTRDRRKLIDIGAAGPLAGLIVTIPVILYGLWRSPVQPVGGGLVEGNSILYALLKFVSKGEWLPNAVNDVYLHPTARAGWTGLLVTMINLLPIGQLDGGHVATAYFGNRYNRFARRLHQALPVVSLGVFAWAMMLARHESRSNGRWTLEVAVTSSLGAALPWLVWWGLVALVHRLSGSAEHPPVVSKALPASRKVLFWIVVVVFFLILMPMPMRQTLAGPPAPPPPAGAESTIGPVH
jgi:membrane-associated protease RseP (regulator of RpoE activity)